MATTDAAPPRRAYSIVSILLHWLIAALIVLQVVLARRMEGRPTPESFAITQLHKSIGISVLILSLARLGWRLANPPTPLPLTIPAWERRLAHATHVAFYLVMIGMPITGWIMVSTSRVVLPTLLFGEVPWPMIPGLPELAPAARKVWHTIGQTGHGLIIKFAYVLIALHVAGALKHQFFAADEPVLGRMAPGAVPGRRAEPRLLLIALAAVAVVVFGRLVQPPRPAMAPPPAAAAVVPAPLEAQPPATPTTPPAAAATPAAAPATPAAPVRWIVLPASRLEFESAWGGQPLGGRFKRWRADIVFSPQALDRSKISVQVDVASVETGDAQRDASLPSGDWFDAENHPKATFTATRFESQGPGRFVAHGALTLRGVTRPAALPFRLEIVGGQAHATGALKIDRTAFGVGQGQFAATDQIPAAVTVRIDVRAKAAP